MSSIGWLGWSAVASALIALVLVRIAEQLFGLIGIASAAVFGGIWTAVTTMVGMRSFNRTARKLRAHNARVTKTLRERGQ